MLSQLVGLSATQVNGVYIFGGDASGSPPYQLDPTSPTGVDQLTTAGATQQIADPTGITFQTSLTAQQLFDAQDAQGNPTAENAFAALTSLQTGAAKWRYGGDLDRASHSLQSASDYLNQQLGFYGAAENRITSAIDLAQKFQVADQTQLSNLQDTNATAVAVQVTQDTTSLNAAMAAEAKKPDHDVVRLSAYHQRLIPAGGGKFLQFRAGVCDMSIVWQRRNALPAGFWTRTVANVRPICERRFAKGIDSSQEADSQPASSPLTAPLEQERLELLEGAVDSLESPVNEQA